MKKIKNLLVPLVLLSVLTPVISVNRTSYIGRSIDASEIRKSHSRTAISATEPEDDEAEPATEDLQAELRIPKPLAHSEVIQLLGDDETRSHELGSPSKHPNSAVLPLENGRMDCSKITMQIFQVLLQNPDSVEPEDYSCGLLNLISHFEKSHGRIRTLEASLHSATTTIRTLETNLQAEVTKTQFLMKEMNETIHKESERAIKAENVIARRVLSEKARVDVMQKNITDMLGSAMVEIKEFEVTLKDMERQWDTLSSSTIPAENKNPLIPEQLPPPVTPINQVKEEDIQKIESQLNTLHEFIKDLSSRVSRMEDGSEEHVNKGITQIFKTYASLANEIEKETERATGEETTLKSLITTEISTLTKSVHALQERITEEKNRVQVIENRRTADLFEEINRAKSEESRLAQKLKDEMSKAAAAFKRLELHVDTQMNSSKLYQDEIKFMAENATKKAIETEERLMEQMSFERTRALSVENSLKVHLETEVSRAMSAEETLKKMIIEEKERARAAEQDLKVATDVEAYRAKGVEYSISAQITMETERAKLEEDHLREEMKGNMTRLLTDVIKEFTRAQNAEKELDDKITNEVLRATSMEQSLITNLNAEQSRASDKENELFTMIKSIENSTKIFDQVKFMVETESERAMKVELNLENQIQEEVVRAKVSEEKIRTVMKDELVHFRNLEQNLTNASEEVVRHTRELELEVRKTIMAEVARAVDAENGLKYQLAAEIDRATLAERTISAYQASNHSDVSLRLQEMTQEIEKDTLRLEDMSLQISRNLTGDILTLAELFDDKLDDLERSENVRLKKLEDEMKKCCSTSSWRWRTPSSSKGKSSAPKGRSEGVISKIMQVFGALPESEGSNNKKKKSSKGSGSSSKNNNKNDEDNDGEGRSISGWIPIEKEDTHNIKEMEEPKVEIGRIVELTPPSFDRSFVPVISNSTNSSKKNETVQIVYGNPVSEVDKYQVPKSYRNSRRANSNIHSGPQVVSVQTANSKVTSTYG